jgi:hypothetical protein
MLFRHLTYNFAVTNITAQRKSCGIRIHACEIRKILQFTFRSDVTIKFQFHVTKVNILNCIIFVTHCSILSDIYCVRLIYCTLAVDVNEGGKNCVNYVILQRD